MFRIIRTLIFVSAFISLLVAAGAGLKTHMIRDIILFIDSIFDETIIWIFSRISVEGLLLSNNEAHFIKIITFFVLAPIFSTAGLIERRRQLEDEGATIARVNAVRETNIPVSRFHHEEVANNQEAFNNFGGTSSFWFIIFVSAAAFVLVDYLTYGVVGIFAFTYAAVKFTGRDKIEISTRFWRNIASDMTFVILVYGLDYIVYSIDWLPLLSKSAAVQGSSVGA